MISNLNKNNQSSKLKRIKMLEGPAFGNMRYSANHDEMSPEASQGSALPPGSALRIPSGMDRAVYGVWILIFNCLTVKLTTVFDHRRG